MILSKLDKLIGIIASTMKPAKATIKEITDDFK